MAFRMDSATMMQNLLAGNEKSKALLLMYASTKAPDIEADMKTNRPWTDRTGMAKARLSTNVSMSSDKVRFTLAHGVEYGIWLELANESNYAIIKPTMDKFGPIIVSDLQGIVDKIKFK